MRGVTPHVVRLLGALAMVVACLAATPSASAGTLHTRGIGRSGALYCWGDNEFGQLGDGTRKIRTRPTRVGTRTDRATVEVRADHTWATQQGGRL